MTHSKYERAQLKELGSQVAAFNLVADRVSQRAFSLT